MSHTKLFEHLKIKLEAIISATNNFADENCIGKGGFGKVYKGEVIHSKGQSMVAFKRLDSVFGQGNPEFWKEIMMLSRYRHENIVSLLGFCDESDEKILVYEYASKKSLDLYLNSDHLTWIQRLNICLGAARGLSYLHNPVGTQHRVLHRDIKSSNILLDGDWNAKISDFGLSKLGPANQPYTFLLSNLVGTIGYCDPLYLEMGFLTKESDVYSFGVVLFEVLCGRLCVSYNDNLRPLTRLVRECYEQNKINDIIYGNIRDEINPNSLKLFTTIAYRCLNSDHKERPSMTEIVRVLETTLHYQANKEGWNHCDTINSSNRELSMCNIVNSEGDHDVITEKDLEHFMHLLDGKDAVWQSMMERSTSDMAYQAWHYDPDIGPVMYRSRTVFEDSTPDLVRDFLWDDEFRPKWDPMLTYFKILEECNHTGTMIVHWIRKFPFFCSDREYIIGRRIWEAGKNYYCVTKGVPYLALRQRGKLRRVDYYFSSWVIRPVQSQKGDGVLSSCEVILLHCEDMGIPRDLAKLGFRQGMWGTVKKLNIGFRAYQNARKQDSSISRCALMATIATKISFDSSVELVSGEQKTRDVNTRNGNVGGVDWRWLAVGVAVAVVCGVRTGAIGKVVLVGVGQRFGRRR